MREEIIKYLSECNLVELNHIIDSSISRRGDCVSNEVSTEYEYQSKVVLCEVIREKYKGQDWEPWEYFLIAHEDKAQYDKAWEIGNGEPFLQQGECQTCKIQLASHAKKVICPMCGEIAALT
jgi:hypothetical protein